MTATLAVQRLTNGYGSTVTATGLTNMVSCMQIVIQYPAIDGYKLLPDQEQSAHFKAEFQVIPIYYRTIKSGESPDESLILRDAEWEFPL